MYGSPLSDIEGMSTRFKAEEYRFKKRAEMVVYES